MKADWDFWLTALLYAAIPLALLYMLWSGRALAFPEMSRHGYASCATCHVSPSGGGILTAYGKVQAEELLATWKLGVEPIQPTPLSLGAQFRALQIQTDNAKLFRQSFILMQADAEAAANVGSFTLAATLGAGPRGEPISRRHYVVAKPRENISIRIGKFMPFFGLGLPDHNLSIREAFSPGSERYALETGIHYDAGSTFATYSKGEGIIRQAFTLGQSQVGLSLRGTSEVFEGGAFAVWAVSDDVFLLTEAVYSDRAYRGYARLQYQPIHGLGFYAHRQEFKNRFLGAGLQFIPVGGTELRTEINKTEDGYFAVMMVNLWL